VLLIVLCIMVLLGEVDIKHVFLKFCIVPEMTIMMWTWT